MTPSELVDSVTARGRIAAQKVFPDDWACRDAFLVGWLQTELNNALEAINRPPSARRDYLDRLEQSAAKEVAP